MRKSMFAALFAVIALISQPAQARFGKKSRVPEVGENTPESPAAAPRRNAPVGNARGSGHAATGVGQPSRSVDAPGLGNYRGAPRSFYGQRPRGDVSAWGFGYSPFWETRVVGETVVVQDQTTVTQAPSEGNDLAVSAAGSVMLFGSGGALDVTGSIEGARWGGMINFTGLMVAADDGSRQTDGIGLGSGFATYSLVSNERGRLRLEGGATWVFAPDVAMLGPAMGVSAVMGLLGPVGLDASLRVVPFPYRQIDGQAGLSLGLGPVGCRAGYRALYLNDAGQVDGTPHADLFAGPYVGMELLLN